MDGGAGWTAVHGGGGGLGVAKSRTKLSHWTEYFPTAFLMNFKLLHLTLKAPRDLASAYMCLEPHFLSLIHHVFFTLSHHITNGNFPRVPLDFMPHDSQPFLPSGEPFIPFVCLNILFLLQHLLYKRISQRTFHFILNFITIFWHFIDSMFFFKLLISETLYYNASLFPSTYCGDLLICQNCYWVVFVVKFSSGVE